MNVRYMIVASYILEDVGIEEAITDALNSEHPVINRTYASEYDAERACATSTRDNGSLDLAGHLHNGNLVFIRVAVNPHPKY